MTESHSFDKLNDDALGIVIGHLTIKEQLRLIQVNHHLQNITLKDPGFFLKDDGI